METQPKPGDWLTDCCYVADKIGGCRNFRLIVISIEGEETTQDTEVRGKAIRDERLARKKLVDRRRANGG